MTRESQIENITSQYENDTKVYLTDLHYNGVKTYEGSGYLTIIANSGFNVFQVEKVSETSLRLKTTDTTWPNSYVGRYGKYIAADTSINNSILFQIVEDHQFGTTLRESDGKKLSLFDGTNKCLRTWDPNFPQAIFQVHKYDSENAWQYLGDNQNITGESKTLNVTHLYESGTKVYLTDMKLNGIMTWEGSGYLTMLPNSGFNVFLLEKVSETSLRLKTTDTTWPNSYVGRYGKYIAADRSINDSIHFEIVEDQFGITLRESGGKKTSVFCTLNNTWRIGDLNFPYVLIKVHKYEDENPWQHLRNKFGPNGGGKDDF